MKNMLRYSLIILFVGIISTLKAQTDTPFEKALFKDRKDQFKKAVKNIEQGDMYFEQGKSLYKAALPFYLEANEFNPNSSELNYKIGLCYLYSTYKTNALQYLLKAYKLNPNVSNEIHYYLGRAYHLNLELDKAIEEYQKQKSYITKDSPITMEMIDKRIKECNYGKEYMANPERVFIDNIGNVVNTKYPEYGAIITTDESVMMFTSRRPDTEGGGMDPFLHEYFEDIYITTKVDGKWTTPKNMGKPVNSDEHDATVALSPDGSVLLIYHDDKGDGNIYQCVLKGDEWSKPKKLNKTVNSPQHESSACYTADGKTLYFVSSREGGFGKHDIYVTHWDEKKEKWSEAKNLGGVINTKYNEESVLIHPDGKTLYFSSQGHTSMGGYDIFKSELQEDGTWSKPQNLGYPVNSADDDVFFVINASGRRGYYSSVKKDGYGEKDIYMITFLGPEKPLVLNSEDNLIASIAQPVTEKIVEKPVDGLTKKITLLKGMVREVGTLKPIGAELELIDVEENKTLATFQSNEKTGKYLLSLPSGKNYGLAVKAEGYLFHSENFNIPDSAAYQEIVKNIDMKPIEVGQTIVLKNIFYDYNKATLRKESINELDRLVKLLKDNPTIKIELSAHTDSRGSDAYNQKLSQARAQSVVDYLIEHGISKDRLVAKGMGESQPIYDDAYIAKLPTKEEKEWAHQQNRRTEFKIISK
tara:strand:- start:5657 stop:7753 length:2097 start_codon:yes stop_codon:yes gene_type:complete